ncbi:MAG: DUF983 domain-containing protein [Planctomycetaceae bacterium]
MTASPDEPRQIPQLSIEQAVSRGIRLRCPICAKGRLFRGWFRMHSECENCGFTFERAPGYFLGSTYINYAVTAGLSTAAFVVLRFVYRVPKEFLLPVLLSFCVVFPLVFFRFARSLWLSLDCFFDRTGASEASTVRRREGSRTEVSNNGG